MHWRVGRTERGVNVLQCGDSDDHLQLFFSEGRERERGGTECNNVSWKIKTSPAFLEQTIWTLIIFLDDTWEEISPGKSRNTMKMEHLSRAELNTELECQVANWEQCLWCPLARLTRRATTTTTPSPWSTDLLFFSIVSCRSTSQSWPDFS